MPPASAISLFHDAMKAYRQQDYPTASDRCRALLRQNRNDANALMLLAEIAAARQQPREELDHLTRAARSEPKNARIRERLGNYYTFHGHYAKALAQFEKALKLDGGLLGAVAGMAETYELQGRIARARRLLEPLAAAPRPEPRVSAVLMRIMVNQGELDGAIDLGQRLLAADPPPGMGLRDACFQLARAHERRGDHSRAFAAAERANGILAPHFDPEAYRRSIDLFIDTFTPQRLAEAPRPSAPSELPVFIVGVPRCGSTLVERILDAHPQVHGAGEIRAMLPIVGELSMRINSTLAYPRCIADLGREDVEALGRSYLEELSALAPWADRISNKDLGNHQHLGLIDILFPRARVIHCRRDPLDTCLSCYMQPFTPTTCPFASDLRHLGLYYRQYARLMAHWRSVLRVPLLEVDYEELIADQEGVSRRLVEFCGLPWDEACLRFYATKRHDRTLSYDQVRRPIYHSSRGRAARFGPRLDPLREALGEPAPEA